MSSALLRAVVVVCLSSTPASTLARQDAAPAAGEKPAQSQAEAPDQSPAAAQVTGTKVPFAPLGRVETKGTGPTALVLVPGLTCDWKVWDGFIDRNRAKYTMYAVTLPGFGATTPPERPANDKGTPWLDNAVAAVASLIEERKLERPVIIGHSLGGHIALRMAIEHGDKIAGALSFDGGPAIPLGPAPIPLDQRIQAVETMIAPRMLAMTDEEWNQQQDLMAKTMVTSEARSAQLRDMFRTTPTQVGARYMLELIKSDVTGALVASKTPHKVVAAVNDEPDFGQSAEVMRSNWKSVMSGAREGSLVFIEGSRHFIMDDKPVEFDQAVAGFVDETRKGQ